MERQLFLALYRLLESLPSPRRFKVIYSNVHVALVLLWARLNERPDSWSTRPENWPPELLECIGLLPSSATLSRRSRTVGVLFLLEMARQAGREQLPAGAIKIIDSKVLPVSGITQDVDAKTRGRASGGCFCRGYRLHAIIDATSLVVEHWTLLPINRNDKIGALELLPKIPSGSVVLADNQYDSNRLYPLASNAGCQLLAPPRHGKLPRDGGRRSTPERKDSLAIVLSAQGKTLMKLRRRIESAFARLANTPGLLGPLPNWVRRPRRIALWIAGKLLLDTIRLVEKQRLTT